MDLWRRRQDKKAEEQHFANLRKEQSARCFESPNIIPPSDINVVGAAPVQQTIVLGGETALGSSLVSAGVEAAATYFAQQKRQGKHGYDIGSKVKDDARVGSKTPKCPFHTTCSQVHPHGLYEDAGYHHQNSRGKKSPAPIDGQWALDFSVNIKKSESQRRIGMSRGQIVVLAQTRPMLWHGHVRTWKDLDVDMRNAIKSQGWVNKKGKITC